MRTRLPRVTASAVASLLLIASCGGSDDSVEPADDPTLTDATPSPTDSPATDPEEAEVQEEVPADGSLTEECLQGDWVMDAETTAALMGTLLPGFPLEVDGTMAMTFAGSNVEHYINMVVTFTLPTGTVSGSLDQRMAGTYAIDDDLLTITNDSIEGGWGNLQGTLGGVAVDVPVPPAELPPFTGGPATCDDDLLTVGYTSGLADAVAEFNRA